MTQTLLLSKPSPPTAIHHTRLVGALSGVAVDQLQRELTELPETPRQIVLDATAVTEVDPVAAARLLFLCEQLERRRHYAVRLTGLAPALVRRLRLHPLLAFVPREDALFRDPFATLAPSRR
jgi:anti-anti-sigma regulatory factor